METQLTINDLPPDVVGQMKQAIRKDSAIQALQKRETMPFAPVTILKHPDFQNS